MYKKNPLLLILFILIFSSCQSEQNQMPVQSAIPLPVVEVPRQTVTTFDTYPVSIEGTVNSAVRAKISGYITKVLVDEGQAVNEGLPLFTLETLSLSQEAEAAQANVQAAQVEVNKLKPLVESGIISEVQLETAQARLEQAKAAYSSVSASIGYATIKSPVDGFAGAIPYRIGTLVSPADPTPLTTVSDTRQIYAYFAMNEKAYLDFILNTEGESLDDKIAHFPPVDLELVNGDLYEHKGKIETVTGQVNQSTGTVSFRAIFPNPKRILANGNSGRIKVPKQYEDVLVVPEVSTFEQQGLVYVYKLSEDSTALSNPIQIIDRVNNMVLVQSGLEEGDIIIAEGLGKIRHDSPVIPQPVEFDSVAHSLEVIFK